MNSRDRLIQAGPMYYEARDWKTPIIAAAAIATGAAIGYIGLNTGPKDETPTVVVPSSKPESQPTKHALLTRKALLSQLPDAKTSLLDCTKAGKDSKGNSAPLTIYADPSVGTKLRETPDPEGVEVKPFFPRGEKLQVKFVSKVELANGDTEYWAMNPVEASTQRTVNRGMRPTFTAVAAENTGDPSSRVILMSFNPADFARCKEQGK